MDAQNFTYWLKGFFEIGGSNSLTEAQVQIVKDHLDLVFNKVTPNYCSTLPSLIKVGEAVIAPAAVRNSYLRMGLPTGIDESSMEKLTITGNIAVCGKLPLSAGNVYPQPAAISETGEVPIRFPNTQYDYDGKPQISQEPTGVYVVLSGSTPVTGFRVVSSYSQDPSYVTISHSPYFNPKSSYSLYGEENATGMLHQLGMNPFSSKVRVLVENEIHQGKQNLAQSINCSTSFDNDHMVGTPQDKNTTGVYNVGKKIYYC